MNKVLIMILVQVLLFWMKERRNHYNHNFYLLQSNISINLYNYWIYFSRAGTHLHDQSKFAISTFLYHCWLWILIGVKVRSNSTLSSNLVLLFIISVSLKYMFWFFSIVQLIIYNQHFYDITKVFIICSLKMFLSYSTLTYL